MVALCGFGEHAKDVLKNSPVSMDAIDIIVDRNIKEEQQFADGEKKIISYDRLREIYISEISKAIIGTSHKFYDEIYAILSNMGIEETKIVGIDDWVNQLYEGCMNTLVERDEFLNMVRKCKQIPRASVKKARCFSSREDALYMIPQNGICAEIGVAYGDFSRKIIDIVNPQMFYAIDCYPENISGIWPGDKKLEETNYSLYDYYNERFSTEISNGTVKMLKGWSWDVMSGFPDDYFDFIYLDADHALESVKRDIEQIGKKIKNGGIVQFNDYTYQANYGVVPAVNEFVFRTCSDVLGYCFATDGFADIVVRVNK